MQTGFDQQGLAIGARCLSGFGHAAFAMVLPYVALHEAGEQGAEAIVAAKICFGLGMFVMGLASLPLSLLEIVDQGGPASEYAYWGDLALTPSVVAALLQILVHIPGVFGVVQFVKNDHPPLKCRNTKTAGGFCSVKVVFWMAASLMTGWIALSCSWFVPVFKYTVAVG